MRFLAGHSNEFDVVKEIWSRTRLEGTPSVTIFLDIEHETVEA